MFLTTRGVLLFLLATPIFMAVTWVAPLVWVGGAYLLVALVLCVLDWRWAGHSGRFALTRTHDTKLSLGAENRITLAVRNPLRRAVQIDVRDEPPPPFVISDQVLSGWLPPLGVWEATYTVKPLRRGDYTFGDLNLRWRGPLGLLVRQAQFPATVAVRVYPNLLNVRRYDLLLRQNRLQELGLRHARLLGQGTEFERLREYQPDDEYRRINWKATARRRRPVTTEYQTERSQNIVAVLDIGRMMQSPVADMAKLDYVINAALLLGYVATGMGDKVGLMTFADGVPTYLAPRQGRGQFYKMLELLYAVEPQPVEPDYQRALSYLALRQRKRALLLIFTDVSGGLSMEHLIQNAAMLSKRSLPLVVTIRDPDVQATAVNRPSDSLGVHRQTAAQQLLSDRQVTLETLERRGVLTLDVAANQLSIAVVNRYLDLKRRLKL